MQCSAHGGTEMSEYTASGCIAQMVMYIIK
jgi:hypothetical protein